MSLNENIRLERDIEKAGSSQKTYYRQFMTPPKDVRKYGSNHGYGRNFGNDMSPRYNDSDGYKRKFDRDRFRSIDRFGGYDVRD